MKILPCPFCGGKAVVDKYPVRGYEPAISFEVRCSLCNQKRVRGYFDTVYKSEKWARRKAIEAWNKRPSPWHTETPTEEGDYLCWVAFPNQICVDTEGSWKCIWEDGKWYENQYEGKLLMVEDLGAKIIAWQKINPPCKEK